MERKRSEKKSNQSQVHQRQLLRFEHLADFIICEGGGRSKREDENAGGGAGDREGGEHFSNLRTLRRNGDGETKVCDDNVQTSVFVWGGEGERV